MRVLCTGDLHIGRRSTRLPAGIDPAIISCASAWTGIVSYAIDQHVDLVAISGDLVDEGNRFYESLGPLERGLRRLREAGIPVVAVAGNHDHDVLPELARTLPAGCLTLLGAEGRWERATIESASGERLHVDGWSFPARHVRENPLHGYVSRESADAPVLGLLHADLDAPGSLYAPVALADLHRAGGDLWLLGHVHIGRLREVATGPCVLYPGSPHPMDPGEPGEHGIWMVELARGTRPVARRVALASVRYDSMEVDLTGVEDLPAARLLMLDQLRETATRWFAESEWLRHVSVRVRLTGRCSLHRALDAEVRRMSEDLQWELARGTVTVDLVENLTRPQHDLVQVAEGRDAAAILARVLCDLASPAGLGAHPALERAVHAAAAAVRSAKPYASLATDDTVTGGAAARAALAYQANVLLDALLAQREGVQ